MKKFKKTAALIMALLSVFGTITGGSLPAQVSAASSDVSSSAAAITLDSSKGATENDVVNALNNYAGSKIKLVGKFTATSTWRLYSGTYLDMSSAVVSCNTDLLFVMYSASGVTVKGGTCYLGNSTQLVKVSGSDNVIFDSVTVNGGGNFDTGVFFVWNSDTVTVKNCAFKYSKSKAVFNSASPRFAAVNNTFTTIYGHGIAVLNSDYAKILGNTLSNITGDAFNLISYKTAYISGNNSSNIKLHPNLDIDTTKNNTPRSGCGMLLFLCDNVKIGKDFIYDSVTYTDNVFKDTENYGLHINQSSNTDVYGTEVINCGSNGVHNSGSPGTKIDSCYFYNCTENGIFFTTPSDVTTGDKNGCKNAVISNNKVELCHNFGIFLSKNIQSTLSGNNILRCTDYGIYLNWCSNITSTGDKTSNTKAKNGSGIGNNYSTGVSITSTPTIQADTKLSISRTNLSLVKGNSQTIKIVGTSVTWTTSNNSAASVSNGKITGVSAGTAIITAKTKRGKTAYCTVTVTNPAVASVNPTGITLNKTFASAAVGTSFTLTATVLPSNASDKTVKWSTDKSYIASVDQNGTVKANSPGTATITAKTSNGKTAVCTVTVAGSLSNKSAISASEIMTDTTVTLGGQASGGTAPYKYAYYYKKSTDSTFTKLCYVNGSAYVSSATASFTPKTAGTYTIRINVKDSTGKTVQKDFTLTVKANPALTNNSNISSSTVNANTEVKLYGSASGGTTPYKYAYYYKKSTDSSFTKICYVNGSAYVASTTASFTPTSAGTYTIRVNVKDNTGKTVQKDMKLTVK